MRPIQGFTQSKIEKAKQFYLASIRDLESLASFLGPKKVSFLSQYNKILVPLRITAANKQQSVLMSLQYKVTVPDHDFVKVSQKKLSPACYAGAVIKENGLGDPSFVTYSGLTFISVLSAKHDKADSGTYAYDIE